MSQSWIEVTSSGSKISFTIIPYIAPSSKISYTSYAAASSLPTGDIVVASDSGVYKLKISCELLL